ncbi:hypothetical protein A2U01_0056713 [Trifolium medium]|uniref:Uncharacterized protein n=1 Tax=Trifolium medium TaxID=97028 RepID=A0A392RH87_9FABA|nr:hypothetical protein [Trifolium medium]
MVRALSLLPVHHSRRQSRLSSPQPRPPAVSPEHHISITVLSLSLSRLSSLLLVHTRRQPPPPSLKQI